MSSTPALDGSGDAPALMIREQGGFWVGVGRRRTDAGTVPEAAMFVQFQIPAEQRHRLPVVMVHGGGGQGTDYLSTPDGRPGWATRFLQAGFAVYVVDRPGHGRSPYHPGVLGPIAGPPPSYEFLMWLFCDGARQPGSQWPGTGEIGDPALSSCSPARDPRCPRSPRTRHRCAAAGPSCWIASGPRS